MKVWRCFCVAFCPVLMTLFLASTGRAADIQQEQSIGNTPVEEAGEAPKPLPDQTGSIGGEQESDKTANGELPEGPSFVVEEEIDFQKIEEKEVETKGETIEKSSDSGKESVQGGEGEHVLRENGTEEEKPDANELTIEPEEPNYLEPKLVRELTGIESGYNESNPVWSPSGRMIAFERSSGDKKEIIIARRDGSIVEKVYFRSSKKDGEMDFFFPGLFEEVSYNSGISWSPGEDRFVFMSNGGGGNYDLYLRSLGNGVTKRLTEHKEKDGHAQWSPSAEQLIFVSGRSGKGDLYLMDLTAKGLRRLTGGKKAYLYPQWSPDGRKIVTIYGSNENHDIYLFSDIMNPHQTPTALTSWTYDDLRPVWSPDGKKIAFYSNYNSDDDPKIWSLVVIAADGSDPIEGEGLVAKVVASDVIPDVERGPAWLPDNRRIIYVKNDRQAYNPIYVVDILEKTNIPLKTGTKMNHDVVCSSDGTIAFRAQVRQWDHIYIARLEEEK